MAQECREPDKITIQAIDPDTGMISARKAHELRLRQPKTPKPRTAEQKREESYTWWRKPRR